MIGLTIQTFYWFVNLNDCLPYSKTVSGSIQSIATTTLMPVWSSPSWWRMDAISTFLKPVASSSRWSTSPSMVSSSPLCRRSASTHYNSQSYSSTQHRNIGNTRACKKSLWTFAMRFCCVSVNRCSHFLHIAPLNASLSIDFMYRVWR